jgi:uncharacterized protein (DUF169 family)
MELKPLTQDLSVYEKFNFERAPVGVKFTYREPEGVQQLDTQAALCEMLKLAQQRDAPFYITKENENCTGMSSFPGSTNWPLTRTF